MKNFIYEVKKAGKNVRVRDYCECGCKGSEEHADKGITRLKSLLYLASKEELIMLGDRLAKMRVFKKVQK